MLRTTKLIGTSALTIASPSAYDCLSSNVIHAQCVRWKRKPLWLPTAKTKEFRVPKRITLPDDEALEIKRLYNNYRTYMKSISSYLVSDFKASQVEFDEAFVRQTEEKDFARCVEINDEWNRRAAEQREARILAEHEERKAQVLRKLMEEEEDVERQRREADESVRKLKEVASTFVTEKNIDEAIEAALERVVDHDAAVDSHGRFHTGKYEPEAQHVPRQRASRSAQ